MHLPPDCEDDDRDCGGDHDRRRRRCKDDDEEGWNSERDRRVVGEDGDPIEPAVAVIDVSLHATSSLLKNL